MIRCTATPDSKCASYAWKVHSDLFRFTPVDPPAMNDAALFEATVPVFRHYVQRVDALLLKLSNEQEPLLQRTLAPHAFSAAEHLETALGFVSRTMFPLFGQAVCNAENRASDRDSLVELASGVRALLQGITARDLDGASSRLVRHAAGAADLEQDATTFVTVFALPNFFFHVAVAFAIFRHEGVDIGMADFDGLHVYASGFHF